MRLFDCILSSKEDLEKREKKKFSEKNNQKVCRFRKKHYLCNRV